jgi:hypothetical protein
MLLQCLLDVVADVGVVDVAAADAATMLGVVAVVGGVGVAICCGFRRLLGLEPKRLKG